MKTLFLDDEQCKLLREMLDFVPLRPRYLPLVADLLQRIPESVAQAPSADSAPPTPLAHRELGGGFAITAYTPRGASMMSALEKVLRPLGTVTECSICRREHGREIVHEAE